MKADTRAVRRAQNERVKARTRQILRRWFGKRFPDPDPRVIGVNASTHCRPCGCSMCQANPNEVPRPRERAFDYPDLP